MHLGIVSQIFMSGHFDLHTVSFFDESFWLGFTSPRQVFIAVYIDSYVTMSSDLYGTCRHCFYGTRFGYCSKGTKSSSDNIVLIFIRPII